MNTVSIIKHNLGLMLSDGECTMLELLKSESMGGNAGRFTVDGKVYSCVAANFYYDEFGQIICFSNQDEVLDKKYPQGTFKIVPFPTKPASFRIVRLFFGKNSASLANSVLEATVIEYNTLFGAKAVA